jgi:hypothetical protein
VAQASFGVLVTLFRVLLALFRVLLAPLRARLALSVCCWRVCGPAEPFRVRDRFALAGVPT